MHQEHNFIYLKVYIHEDFIYSGHADKQILLINIID